MNDFAHYGKYRIASTRLRGDFYNGGVYFVTICTQGRACYFGDILADDGNGGSPHMVYSPVGQYASEQLEHVGQHYPYAEIPVYVVMPNHVHAVVVISDTGNDTVAAFKAGGAYMTDISRCKGKLSVVIGGIKSSITRFANAGGFDFAWQARFYEHIVRDQADMNRISQYVEHNVQHWYEDIFFA